MEPEKQERKKELSMLALTDLCNVTITGIKEVPSGGIVDAWAPTTGTANVWSESYSGCADAKP